MPDAAAESTRNVATPPHPATPPPPPPPPPAPLGDDRPSPGTLQSGPPHGLISGAPPGPGQFTVGWQIMLAASWTVAFFAFAAVWKTSEEIGIGTWWLGPRAQPQPVFVRVAPFAITLAVGMLAVYNVRRTAWMSAAASIAIALGAAFDMSRSGGLAAIEFAIAGSMLLVSIGAMFGAIRTSPID